MRPSGIDEEHRRAFVVTSPTMIRFAAAMLGLTLVTAGCAGMAPTDDATSLIEQTTAGKSRCVSAGDERKLFVVEWDATDASTFQARAARDVVLVRYEDCQLRVIDGCSDGSLAGRYGTYREPVMTSGATESFTVATQDELDAKLPLGALSLGAELSSDRALELSYHVSGTALSTRDEIYRGDIQDNPRCSEATHVVVAYNLGAFVLETKDQKNAAAEAAYGDISVTGRHDQQRNTLKRAGDLSACSKVDNHPCRAPIRLTLRPIREGNAPAPTTVAPAPGTPVSLAQVTQQMNAIAIESQANQKLMRHDGKGCLADLDKADVTDPAGKPRRLELRARCEMRAGMCDQGKAHYREARRAWYRTYDKTGLASDAVIENDVEQMAKRECATAAGGGKSLPNSTIDIVQQIAMADQRGDTDACIAGGRALQKLAADAAGNHLVAAGLSRAASCAAKGGKCAAAKPFYITSVRLLSPDLDAATAESAFALNVKECQP